MLLVDCAEGVTLGEINADSDLLIVGDRFGLTVCKGDTVFFDEEVRQFEFGLKQRRSLNALFPAPLVSTF